MNVGLPAPEPAIVREFGHLITENANEKVVIVQQFDELFEKAMKLRSKAFLLDISARFVARNSRRGKHAREQHGSSRAPLAAAQR